MKEMFFTNKSQIGSKNVPLKARSGMSLSKTPAPKSEKIYGSEENKKGSSSTLKSAKNIKLSEKTLTSIKNLVKTFNKKNPSKKITLPAAKAVVRRGMGAYSSTHRPTISGGKPNSRVAWGLARLKAFLYKAEKGKSKSGKYVQDDDLFNELGIRVNSYETGGELQKGIKAEKEHRKTIHDIYSHKISESKAFEAIAKDHIKEDPNYYSNMQKFATGGLVINGQDVNIGSKGVLKTRKGDINITITNITDNWVIFNDEQGKRKDNPRDKFLVNFTPDGTSAGTQPLATFLASTTIQKLPLSNIPSTDPSTWNAVFEKGDKVRLRKDFADNYESEENLFEILDVIIENVGSRPQNPKARFYNLSGDAGTWEGKDLELAESVISQPTTPLSVKKPTTQVTKGKFSSSNIFKEEQETVYFDKEANYTKIYENYLIERYKTGSIENYSSVSRNEIVESISENFSVSISKPVKDLQDVVNIRKYISYYFSPYNEVPRTKELNEGIKKIIEDVNALLLSDKSLLPEKQAFLELEQRINATIKLRDILPPTSLDTIQKLNNKIKEDTNFIAERTMYNPELYFSTYFLQNCSVQKDADFKELLGTITELDSFELWFKGSKVVDDEGKPLLVYHGRYNPEVTQFKFDNFPARYFAENLSYAQWFANLKGQGNGLVYQCYLKVLNPMDFTNFSVKKVKYEDFIMYVKLKYGYDLPDAPALKALSDNFNGAWIWQYFRNGVDWVNLIKNDGKFDGIHFIENNPQEILPNGEENSTPAWMVFSNKQIKSANGNVLFSSYSEDMRFAKGGKLETNTIPFKFGGR